MYLLSLALKIGLHPSTLAGLSNITSVVYQNRYLARTNRWQLGQFLVIHCYNMIYIGIGERLKCFCLVLLGN
jgi:hypothetical protein